MQIDDQLWQMVSGGLLTVFLDRITNTTNAAASPDAAARELLWQRAGNAYKGWITTEVQESLKIVPGEQSVNALVALIDVSSFTDPKIREDLTEAVVNPASDGTTLSADTPSAGISTHVWQWDFIRFNYIGALATNATPPAGTYVLANIADTALNGNNTPSSAWSLPSGYLTIT